MQHEDGSEDLTWNQYLDDVIRHLSAAEKHLVYQAVGLSRTSFQRWRNGDNLPDAAHIPPLLKALAPEPRARLLVLMREDPRMRALLPDELLHPRVPSLSDGIASSFYADLFRMQRESNERFWALSGALLRHALSELEGDEVQPVGLHLLVARCLTVSPQGKVRSLRSMAAIGTPPWRRDLYRDNLLLGAESLAGEAVLARHDVMVPDLLEPTVPVVHRAQERSATAFPIQCGDAIAGAFVVASTQPDFFSPERLTRIGHYADLIRLAFYDADFVPTAQIALGILPAPPLQLPLLATFRQRMEATYRRSLAQDGSFQDLTQVEQRVWQEIETELLLLAMHEPSDLSEGTNALLS